VGGRDKSPKEGATREAKGRFSDRDADWTTAAVVEAARKAEQRQASGKREFVSSGTVGGSGAPTIPKRTPPDMRRCTLSQG
jgi:hypothetical protein